MVDTHKQLRVMIVRLGAMGDILHALPAITALRAAHPGWTLGWAIEPQWRALLAADGATEAQSGTAQMPLVDHIHMVPAKQWGRRPLVPSTLRSILASRREIRAAGYDLCIDLQGAVRSALIARWAAPKRLIGEDKPREPAARRFFKERVVTHGVHVIEQAAEVTRAIAGDALLIGLPSLPDDLEADAWCDRLALSSPFILINPGAGWGAKRWPLERYAETARALASEGYQVAINASPAEAPLARELAALIGSAALALTPTLSQLIALTRRAALVIAGDTGPLHLASALGRPVVGIYGPTDPARNGPFHGDFQILRHPESKRDHTRHAEPEAGLLAIEPAEVIVAAQSLLQATTLHAPAETP